jgi:hypothetical protein
MKIELNTHFEQNFTTGSYEDGIGRAWCSRKACEICNSLVQKKKLKKKYFSSHKLPKQQSTNFWYQGILGLNTSCSEKISFYPFHYAILVVHLYPCFHFAKFHAWCHRKCHYYNLNVKFFFFYQYNSKDLTC